MNPVIKFTTLFGLLAVELAVKLDPMTSKCLAAIFFFVSLYFVRESFYGMRIEAEGEKDGKRAENKTAAAA
jgi:K(+)-stimulated pyrophosphate-energized sodium pump